MIYIITRATSRRLGTFFRLPKNSLKLFFWREEEDVKKSLSTFVILVILIFITTHYWIYKKIYIHEY